MQARDERPSAQDAERALASLLFAMKQQASSPATGPAVQHSSPATGPVAQSSPAYTQAAGSSPAPTPVATGGPTALNSQMNTQELLMALLGQAMAAQNATQQAALAPNVRGATAPAAPSASATPAAAAAITASTSTSHGPVEPPPNSIYHPQPTRSGRMPQAPTHDSSVDPATLLFNDYFDFPSSDDEDDDPDFDPNAPVADFWGDLLAGEKGDGGLTEDEGDWGVGGASGRRGLTSEEFAKELALLTTGLDDELPPPSALAQAYAPGTRTSPRRQRLGPSQFDPSSSSPSSAPALLPPPPRPSRKRPRKSGAPLSPVPEDPPAHAPRAASPSTSAFAMLPPVPVPPLPDAPLPGCAPAAAPAPAIATGDENAPPSSADGEPDAKRKRSSQSRAKYTPEEAKQRRKEQEAARAAKRRAAAKEEKERAANRAEVLERENAELRGRCDALEGRVRALTEEVERLKGAAGPGAGGAGREAEESESDGGEYQVQSSEESSSDESEDDLAEAAQDAAAYLRDVAAELDSLTDPTGTIRAPAAPVLDLASLGSDGRSQLLSIVHSAAKAQGIPLDGGAPTPRA